MQYFCIEDRTKVLRIPGHHGGCGAVTPHELDFEGIRTLIPVDDGPDITLDEPILIKPCSRADFAV